MTAAGMLAQPVFAQIRIWIVNGMKNVIPIVEVSSSAFHEL
jgi:hypothetical protein